MTTTELPQFLEPSELAQLWRMTTFSVQRMCREGRLRGAFKVGRNRWLIPREAVEAIIHGEPIPAAGAR